MGLYCLPRRAGHAAALFSLTLGLSGCSWFHKEPGADVACPATGLVPELAHLTRFQGAGTSFNDETFKADLTGLTGKCTFTDVSVSVDATVKLVVERGPAAQDGTDNFPYFVAIQAPDGRILAKSDFAAPLTFVHGQTRAGSAETVNEVIPLSAPEKAPGYRILIGFQLSPAERAYNLANKVGQ